MYYIEIRSTVRRTGKPKLILLADQHKHTGFRSVYAYTAEVAEEIMADGGTKFMRGTPVYSDTLFMDFDDHDPTEFRELLISNGVAFEEWDSGNRSVHFHVPIVPMYGPHVPNSQRAWVKKHAPTADISFYHPAGQYRLPNTYHAKAAGKCKRLVAEHEGATLQIDMIEPSKMSSFSVTEGNEEDFFANLLVKQESGHRRPHIWLLATMAAESGVAFDTAVDCIRWWNDKFCIPSHEDEVIVKQTESAYRRIQQKYG
jgi:hypothetical protein